MTETLVSIFWYCGGALVGYLLSAIMLRLATQFLKWGEIPFVKALLTVMLVNLVIAMIVGSTSLNLFRAFDVRHCGAGLGDIHLDVKILNTFQ